MRPILLDAPAFGTFAPQQAAVVDGRKVFVRGFNVNQAYDLAADAAEQRAETMAPADPRRQQAKALFDALPATDPQRCQRDR